MSRPLDIAAIRAEYAPAGWGYHKARRTAAERDVLALCDEVERLRAWNARWKRYGKAGRRYGLIIESIGDEWVGKCARMQAERDQAHTRITDLEARLQACQAEHTTTTHTDTL